MFLRKVFLASRTKCIFKLSNNTAYVTEKFSPSFPLLFHSFFYVSFHYIYHFFNLCFLYEKDLSNKTLVLSILNSSSFWFGLFSAGKDKDEQISKATLIFPSLSSHFKIRNQS